MDSPTNFWLGDSTAPLVELYVRTVAPAYVVAGAGDLDGNRLSDIVWHNDTNGEMWV